MGAATIKRCNQKTVGARRGQICLRKCTRGDGWRDNPTGDARPLPAAVRAGHGRAVCGTHHGGWRQRDAVRGLTRRADEGRARVATLQGRPDGVAVQVNPAPLAVVPALAHQGERAEGDVGGAETCRHVKQRGHHDGAHGRLTRWGSHLNRCVTEYFEISLPPHPKRCKLFVQLLVYLLLIYN